MTGGNVVKLAAMLLVYNLSSKFMFGHFNGYIPESHSAYLAIGQGGLGIVVRRLPPSPPTHTSAIQPKPKPKPKPSA